MSFGFFWVFFLCFGVPLVCLWASDAFLVLFLCLPIKRKSYLSEHFPYFVKTRDLFFIFSVSVAVSLAWLNLQVALSILFSNWCVTYLIFFLICYIFFVLKLGLKLISYPFQTLHVPRQNRRLHKESVGPLPLPLPLLD
jgi:hypothetical protein